MNFNISRSISITFLLLCCTYLCEDVVAQKITKAFEEYTGDFSGEKIYIHFDKPIYHYSDDIWFKVYLVNGLSNIPNAISEVVYVELIDQSGKLIKSKKVRIENGGGVGDFKLSKDFVEGTYQVRGYTNFMRNFGDEFFFKQRIVILNGNSPDLDTDILSNMDSEKNTADKSQKSNTSTPFHLDFFPEGGDMVEGITNPVGFKATDLNGKGIDVRGEIIDEKGDVVVTFESIKFGIGSFFFRPVSGKTYQAIAYTSDSEWNFNLPEPQSTGFTIRVNNITQGVVKILLKTNIPGGLDNCVLIGQMQGKIILSRDNIKSNRDEAMIILSSKNFPSGILQLTLFGKKNEPYCERLVFVKNDSQDLDLKVSTDKTAYQTRDKVELLVDMKGLSTNATMANSSISVTNSGVIGSDSKYSDNIISNLLLSANLKGAIENPGYYFSENVDATERKRALDNVMITHGWRRFSWKKILEPNNLKPTYDVEHGFSIQGQVVSANKKQEPVNGGYVSLALTSINGLAFSQSDTDENGNFVFSNLDVADSAQVLLAAYASKVKEGRKDSVKLNNKVRILLDQRHLPHIKNSYEEKFLEYQAPAQDTSFFERLDKISSAYDFKNSILLEGITIKRKSNNRDAPFSDERTLYGEPSSRIVMDSIPGARTAVSLIDLLRARVPGLRVVGNANDQQVVMRGTSTLTGGSEPLFLFNGMPVDSSVAFDILPSEVSYIDVLKGTKAAIYGSRAANGVIAIYTRKGDNIEAVDNIVYEDRGVLNYTFNGYDKVREFYAPRYDTDKPEFIKPDYRTTLYWNPEVKTDQEGQAEFTFFTNDNNNSTFKIELEGITDYGQPFRVEKYFYTGQGQ